MTTGTDNKSGASQASSQTSQAEKLDGLIADLDFSDVPEAVRKEVIAKVRDKVKLYDAGYRAKTDMLTDERKRIEADRQNIKALMDIQTELQGNPNMEKAVVKVINDYRSGKIQNSDSSRDTNIKRLDQLIENANDNDTREQLREMRRIVIEETDAPALKSKVQELEEQIKQLQGATNSNRAERVELEIEKLEEEFGKDVVGKYRQDIKASALKYPNQKIRKLFYHYADDSEIEEAVVKIADKRKQKELEHKRNGSLPGGGSIATKVDVPRDQKGRIDWRGFIGNMKQAGKFDR